MKTFRAHIEVIEEATVESPVPNPLFVTAKVSTTIIKTDVKGGSTAEIVARIERILEAQLDI